MWDKYSRHFLKGRLSLSFRAVASLVSNSATIASWKVAEPGKRSVTTEMKTSFHLYAEASSQTLFNRSGKSVFFVGFTGFSLLSGGVMKGAGDRFSVLRHHTFKMYARFAPNANLQGGAA